MLLFNECRHTNRITDVDDLIIYFNSKGRWQRFQNSSLIFGESITAEAAELLQFDPADKDKLYRKAAYVFEVDSSIVYFMYGLVYSDSTLADLRVRSYKDNEVLADELLLRYSDEKQIYRDDYRFDNNVMILSQSNYELTLLSYFIFSDGEIINEKMKPDTIFPRTVIFPEVGQKIRLSNENFNAELQDTTKETIAKGSIVKLFGGGKSCPEYMMIKLDKPYKGFDLVQVDRKDINSYTSIYGLVNDSLEVRPVECFEPSKWPVEDPVLLDESTFIEYQ